MEQCHHHSPHLLRHNFAYSQTSSSRICWLIECARLGYLSAPSRQFSGLAIHCAHGNHPAHHLWHPYHCLRRLRLGMLGVTDKILYARRLCCGEMHEFRHSLAVTARVQISFSLTTLNTSRGTPAARKVSTIRPVNLRLIQPRRAFTYTAVLITPTKKSNVKRGLWS
jgi:hypothetical protein